MQVDIHEAKTHLSRLLKCVISGEEELIASDKELLKNFPSIAISMDKFVT